MSPAPIPESLKDRAPIDNTVNIGEMNSLEDDEEIDPLFLGVLARVQLDKVPRFSLDLRRQLEMQHDNSHAEISIEPAVIEKPIFGGFHALFPIRFADGVKWLLKIPLIGVQTQFDESASAALTSEALTMKFLRANTSIPIPNVYAFDASLDSDLGCPFILLEFISGIPLQECWFDKSRSISQDVMQARRSRILQDIASAMAQLDRFAFDSGGALIFNDDGSPIGAAATKYFDDVADLQQMNYDIDNNIDIPRYPMFYKAGPWTTVESFYLHALDRDTGSTASYARGLCQLLRILYQLIPEPIDTRPKFVLAHPDFYGHNFIVSEDGHLKAVIDWDGVITVPRNLGYEKYPNWLSLDWNPFTYGWEEGDDLDDDHFIDLPPVLAQHRAEYESFMQSSLALERSSLKSMHEVDPCAVTSVLTQRSSTALSLYAGAVHMAILFPTIRFQTLAKVFKEIEKQVEKQVDEEIPWNFDLLSVSESLDKGELDQKRFDMLCNGFKALFRD